MIQLNEFIPTSDYVSLDMEVEDDTKYMSNEETEGAIQTLLESERSMIRSQESFTKNWNVYNFVWRKKVCQWAYSIVDHYSIDNGAVYVMMTILDRFVAVTCAVDGLPAKDDYKLLAMASLLLASRMCDRNHLETSDMISLSQSNFSDEQVEEASKRIVGSPSWLRMIVPKDLLCNLVSFLPVPSDTKDKVLEKATHLSEICVMNFSTNSHRPSVIAVASLLAAVDFMIPSRFCNVTREDKDKLIYKIQTSSIYKAISDHQLQEIKFYLNAYVDNQNDSISKAPLGRKRKSSFEMQEQAMPNAIYRIVSEERIEWSSCRTFEAGVFDLESQFKDLSTSQMHKDDKTAPERPAMLKRMKA
eukprot:CAMPEP_0118699272 /NCGR_PEP_ID=MMETSP0800-20121206/15783_1 /TAXON_ID=210618 ORGANISM="Striatella unipunctata, Strain CCMP2910" /NCGR_SAMPLE_ID=MMETSP0800 /ASSEMBLY_ACC=CAM_ASM_000638 /LENGTH=358 /DNA_ID=CAMNT_0006599423 /DNA_START=27 /DNA_END=1103 /DNA_ORIENTATION=-